MIEERFKQHKNTAINPKSKAYDYPLYRAIRKEGLENFSFQVLEECKKEDLNEREKYWIQYYNTYINDSFSKGYNMTRGGESHENLFDYNLILKLWNEGLNYNQIQDELNCCVNTISKALQKNGISLEDIRERANNYKARKIQQYTLTGKFIKEYNSIANAMKNLLIDFPTASNANICHACEKKITTAYGYLWKYSDDNTSIEELIKNADSKQHHRNQMVEQYDLNNTYLNTYKTIKEACLATGIKTPSSITNACTGRSKTAGGYIWKYKLTN